MIAKRHSENYYDRFLFLMILIGSMCYSSAFVPPVICMRRRNPSLCCDNQRSFSDSTPSVLFSSIQHQQEGQGDDKNSDYTAFRVGIAGAGAVAFGTAAVLADAGHLPMVWSPSGRSTSKLIESNDVIRSKNDEKRCGGTPTGKLAATGALELEFNPFIARSAKELVTENDVILIALPANAHKRIFDEISPFIRNDQHIIISSHASLGAVYLCQLLEERIQNNNNNINNKEPSLTSLPAITAWGTTICTARRRGEEGTVQINTVRQSVDLCTVPVEQSAIALDVCKTLFRRVDFVSREGLLAVSLSNLNPQNHLGIALGNMGRMEKNEAWYQSSNITPNIGRFLEALDQERLAIAEALDNLKTKTIFEHFSWSFHVPITNSISDMNQEIHQIGNDVFGPNTADSRYILEDVPFGLALTITLGNMVEKPAVLHMAGMEIMSAMYGRDFMKENDLLDALQLEKYSLDELKEASYSGRLRSLLQNYHRVNQKKREVV